MPNRFGFDELPNRGAITLRCIWCGHVARTGEKDTVLARHAKTHRHAVQEAAEASRREMMLSQSAIEV